jgi:vacuole morphology and inheritance protein 14
MGYRGRPPLLTHAFFNSSTTVPIAAPGFDRPNRLKGRDEGIRWTELLEKFRSVQEKARRIQRPGGLEMDDSNVFGSKALSISEVKVAKESLRPPTSHPVAKEAGAHSTAAVAQPAKSKTGLAKLSRLGGAVSGSRSKR